MLAIIGNLLWLSTFAIAQAKSVEEEADSTKIFAENGDISEDERSLMLRALRIDMCVYLSRAGQSYMNVHLLALAHALRKAESADEVHIG